MGLYFGRGPGSFYEKVVVGKIVNLATHQVSMRKFKPRYPAFLFYIMSWVSYWVDLRKMVRRKLIYSHSIPRINLLTGVMTVRIMPYYPANYINLSTVVKGR